MIILYCYLAFMVLNWLTAAAVWFVLLVPAAKKIAGKH